MRMLLIWGLILSISMIGEDHATQSTPVLKEILKLKLGKSLNQLNTLKNNKWLSKELIQQVAYKS